MKLALTSLALIAALGGTAFAQGPAAPPPAPQPKQERPAPPPPPPEDNAVDAPISGAEGPGYGNSAQPEAAPVPPPPKQGN